MTNIVITSVDADYLPRMMALYQSLRQHWSKVQLVVYCFDDLTFQVLSDLKLAQLTPIAFSDFISERHQKALANMSFIYELYWSYKPHILQETLRRYPKAQNIIYLDSDIMLLSDPAETLLPSTGHDILLQTNNFSAQEMDEFLPIGYYCAGFMSIRRSPTATLALEWWNERCLEWCLARTEDGKFADQKYLDDWRTRFPGVEEITAIGAGVAPWNVQKYDVSEKNMLPQVNNQPVIYYHYHSFAMNYRTFEHRVTGERKNFYTLSADAVKVFYAPYVAALKDAVQILTTIPEYKLYIQNYPEGQSKSLHAETKYYSFRKSLSE